MLWRTSLVLTALSALSSPAYRHSAAPCRAVRDGRMCLENSRQLLTMLIFSSTNEAAEINMRL
jgi:hypothetical protein